MDEQGDSSKYIYSSWYVIVGDRKYWTYIKVYAMSSSVFDIFNLDI